MKVKLSSIAYGALIACACNVAVAGQTINATQLGTGNNAYAEQRLLPVDSEPIAVISQIGNGNQAGDPATGSGGIQQSNIEGFARADIYQHGDANHARIAQDSTIITGTVATIEQQGNRNKAVITQQHTLTTTGVIRQSGDDNVAALDQQWTDVSFRASQLGVGNRLSFTQLNLAKGPATVRQAGTFNTVSVVQDNVFFAGGTVIEQIGDRNNINSMVQGDSTDAIRQVGTGNTAMTIQNAYSSFGNSSDIVQEGNNNLTIVTQDFAPNQSQIRQIGNNDVAIVNQSHTGGGNLANTSNIRQVGDGFVASVVQAGSNNRVGIYQH